MKKGFFRSIDDYLIDHVFQPICNWLRQTFDWSKRVPQVVLLFAAVIGYVPVITWFIALAEIIAVDKKSWLLFFTFLLMIDCLHEIVKIYQLIQKGLQSDELSEALDNTRLSEFLPRTTHLIASAVALPLIAGILFISVHSDEAVVLLWWIMNVVSSLAASYFSACIDLPKKRRFLAPKLVG